MLPNIIESVEINKQGKKLCIVALSNGTLCLGFEIQIKDAQTDNIEFLESELKSYLTHLSTKIRLRFVLDSRACRESLNHSRSQAIESLGFVENRLFLIFEKELPVFELRKIKNLFKAKSYLETDAKDFLNDISLEIFANLEVLAVPLNIDDYALFLPDFDKQISLNSGLIQSGQSCLGIIKLIKQANHKISMLTFCQNKDQLSLPYRYVVTIESEPALKTERELRQNSNQSQVGDDAIAANNYIKTQNAMKKVISEGARFLKIETQILIERQSVDEVKKSAADFINYLRPLGKFYFESFGTLEAFKAALLGQAQHYAFKEIDEVAPSYLPVCSFGNSIMKFAPEPSSLVLHRPDESLHCTSPFQHGYESYSACIIGLPGSGKSVLGNMITRALHFDPSINIVKLDVGGSHSRETAMLGGAEYEFTIDKPGGFNPFSIIKKVSANNDLVQILSTFLETIVKEDHELFVTKDLKADIEQSLQYYIATNPASPCIDDFLFVAKDYIPRIKLLNRWSISGIYGNAFKEVPEKNPEKQNFENRLKYFNFSKISQALDSDFAQGGLASVMVAFNFDMLFNRQGRRFVFMADEVPVFVQKCFSFFDLSISNIRKYGDGFITIGQKSEHFIVGGKSLLEASPSKFIFTVDAKDEVFSDRLRISNQDLAQIKSLSRVHGKYSEVFHIDNLGKRTYRIMLSPHEYWSYTSKKEDKDKIQNLLTHVPGLTIQEAMQCLSYSL